MFLRVGKAHWLRAWGLFVCAASLLLTLPASARTRIVHVGVNKGLNFVDSVSGSSLTSINLGDTVQWVWDSGPHGPVSGTCTASGGYGNSGTCTPDGNFSTAAHYVPYAFSHTFNKSGSYPYYCVVHMGAMLGTIVVSNTPSPDYALSVSNPEQTVFPGQSASFTGNIAALYGYASTVTLSCQGAGAPASCTPNPASATPSAAGTPFTVTAVANAIQDYSFSIQALGADSDATLHAQPVILHMVDFALGAPSVQTLTVAPGAASASANLLVTVMGNFSGAVTLSCNGLPAGASCNFSPSAMVNPTATTPVLASVSVAAAANTAVVNTPFTVVASTPGAPAPKSQPMTLQVFDFTLGAPGHATVPVASTDASLLDTFTLLSENGFAGSVTLSCAGLPAGAACNFTNNPVPLSANGSVLASYNVSTSSTPPGDYVYSIVANAPGILSKSQSVTLSVKDFAVAISKTSLGAFPNQNVLLPGTVQGLYGYSGVVAVSCEDAGSGLPANCAGAGNLAPGSSFNVTAQAGAATVGTTFNVLGTGPDPGNNTTIAHRQPVTLQVFDFALTQLPPTANVVQGNASAPIAFQISALGAYAGSIQLSCSGSPAVCSFFPAVIAPRAGAQVSVTLVMQAPPGSAANVPFAVTITATSAGSGAPAEISHSAPIALTVNAGNGSADLAVALQRAPSQNPGVVQVGETLHYTAQVSNQTAASNVNATLLLAFSAPVNFGTLPGVCGTVTNLSVSCAFSSANGTPTTLQIPVTAPFARSLSASAFVSSAAANGNAINVVADTTQIRLRPFTRAGIGVKLP
jgi:plastocyanin